VTTTFTLAELERAIRESWSLDTADEDDGWTPGNPSRGQCDVTTLVAHDLLGGEVPPTSSSTASVSRRTCGIASRRASRST
jgi:hypothetical protein